MSELIWTGRKRPFENAKDDSSNDSKVEEKKPRLETQNNCNNSDHTDIYSIGHDIYFYAQINISTSISFQKELDKVYKLILENLADAKKKGYDIIFPPISIHINSPGGQVFSAFAMIDCLRTLKKRDPRVTIHSIIEGRAASAATLVSVTADKRYGAKYGYMLIHQLSSLHWGKYQELKDEMENTDTLMKRIKEIYKDHTKISEEELDQILTHDLYWDANKCLSVGLVDEIL